MGYHHKMSLSERWTALRTLYKRWTAEPGVQMVKVGYERYGMTSDIEYLEEKMEQERCYFPIEELNWPRDSDERSKLDRIQRLEPDFRNGRIHLPFTNFVDGVQSRELTQLQQRTKDEGCGFQILQPTIRTDSDGKTYRLHIRLTQEYLVYPFAPHDDGLDCASRWYDLDLGPPDVIDDRYIEPEAFIDGA